MGDMDGVSLCTSLCSTNPAGFTNLPDPEVDLSVDVFPMANRNDQDNQAIITNLVNHAIWTDANTPGRSAGQFLAAGWPRIFP